MTKCKACNDSGTVDVAVGDQTFPAPCPSCQPETSPVLRVHCHPCDGTGLLPGSNWVAQGSVRPNCFHCNGQGTTPALPCPTCSHLDPLPLWPTCRRCGGRGLVPA